MKQLVLRACWVVPLLMLAANALSWLRYGTDFPFYDDWRAYASGDIGSLELSRLFQVVNNTMSPVGFALDALAQRWLDGNTVAYQLLSMLVVLGGLLWLQWKLLCWAVPDGLVRAVAFAFTVFMLQSATYWGEQNLAYQQALPLLFLLGALYAILLGRSSQWVMGLMVAVLAILAGLSYISGAVSALVIGAILLCLTYLRPLRHTLPVGWVERSEAQQAAASRVRLGGLVMLVAGVVVTGLQFYATRVLGGADRSEQFPVRWPWDPDFWAYLLGKIGRSLGLPFESFRLEAGFALMLSAVLAVVLLVFVWRIFQKKSDIGAPPGPAQSGDGNATVANRIQPSGQESNVSLARIACIYLPLAGAVLVYLALVSFGRAGFRDASIQSLPDVFLFAYQRFHFFWVTLLFPWTVAALLTMRTARSQIKKDTQGSRRMFLAVAVLALGWGLAGVRGVFDVSTYYEHGRQARAETIRCMSQQLGSGSPILCPELALPGWTDWTPAYVHALDMGASFTKYFPLVERDPLDDWIFQGAPEQDAGVRWHDAPPTPASAGGDEITPEWRQGAGDPQMLIEGEQMASLLRCRILEVRVQIRSEQASFMQVFYRPSGEAGFSEQFSRSQAVAGGMDSSTELRFILESPRGFGPVLRIDPVQDAGRFRVEGVQIGCRLQMP